MKNKTQLSARDLQLLSAYIDGELPPKHKKYVDRLLTENPHAQRALENINKVKTLLKYLSYRKVPRNFTVTTPETQRFVFPSMAGVFRYSTAVSALLLVIVLALDYFSPFQPRSSMQSEETLAEKSALQEETRIDSGVSAPIITWNPSSPPMADGFGYGGGGGGELGIGAAQPGPLIPDSIIPPQDGFFEIIPDSTSESQIMEEEQLPLLAEEQSQVESEASALEPKSSTYGNGPILGVRPAEEQGIIQTHVEPPQVKSVDSLAPSLRMIEIVLAGLVVISAVLTYFLRKGKK